MKERGVLVRGLRSRLCAELGREPALSELAEAAGLTPEEVAAAETATEPVISLQTETGEGGLTLEGMLSGGGMEDGLVERLALRGVEILLRQLEQGGQAVHELAPFRLVAGESVDEPKQHGRADAT